MISQGYKGSNGQSRSLQKNHCARSTRSDDVEVMKCKAIQRKYSKLAFCVANVGKHERRRKRKVVDYKSQ